MLSLAELELVMDDDDDEEELERDRFPLARVVFGQESIVKGSQMGRLSMDVVRRGFGVESKNSWVISKDQSPQSLVGEDGGVNYRGKAGGCRRDRRCVRVVAGDKIPVTVLLCTKRSIKVQ